MAINSLSHQHRYRKVAVITVYPSAHPHGWELIVKVGGKTDTAFTLTREEALRRGYLHAQYLYEQEENQEPGHVALSDDGRMPRRVAV